MRARRTVCLLAAGIALPAMAGGPACRAELPPGLVATPVAEDVATAGMAMSITHVRGKEGVDALLRRAGQLWTERGYVASRGRVGTWEVLSGLGKDCLLTLQLAGDGGGSAGYLARSRKAGAAGVTARTMGVPLPADATVTSSVASSDDGRKGLVVALRSPRSAEALGKFFLDRLAQERWSGARAHVIQDRRGAVRFVKAQRERTQIDIVIWGGAATQAVLTVSEAL